MTRATHLERYLAKVGGRSYELGKWDCVLFIAGWVELVTGKRHVPDGLVWCEQEIVLTALGCTTKEELIERFLPRKQVGLARMGDVVGRIFSYGYALGICDGSGALFLSKKIGFVRGRILSCHACWGVGQ